MCGIYLTNLSLNIDRLNSKLDKILHRGPDFTGTLQRYNLSFGHTRLSILDLDSRSNQPMAHEEFTIVYNGEIYNYKNLKKELEELGELFSTNGDTEVILIGYKVWGKKVVSKLNGMFAFSIYDSKNNEVFSARDRLGVKPFYYSWDNGFFEICSQIAPLSDSKSIDYDAIEIYLQTGYIPSPWTIYKEVKKLSPGFWMTIDLNNNTISCEQYWNLKPQKITKLSYEAAKNRLHELLDDAVKIRLHTDVPIGSFLSGGVDSALVSAIAQKHINKLKTFTVGFNEPKYDESGLARRFSEVIKSEHYENICNVEDLISLLPVFFKSYGEPFADSSAIPSLLLNKKTKEHITVALSGDGGDESFFGYNHFEWLIKFQLFFNLPKYLRNKFGKLFPFKWFGKRGEGIYNITQYKDLDDFIVGIFTGFGNILLKKKNLKWLNNYNQFKFNSKEPLQRAADLNINLWLENDSNVKVDRASMAYGVEVRSPFLDYRVIEFARTLPISYRIKNGKRKRILKDILSQYIPENIFDVPKKGFAIPLSQWVRNELREDIEIHLNDNFLNSLKCLNTKKFKKYMRLHFNGKGDYSTYIWRVYVLSKWFESRSIDK